MLYGFLMTLLVARSVGQVEDVTEYTPGEPQLSPSPVTLEELELLKRSLMFGEDDQQYLRLSLEVLRPQVEDILDVWYGFVGSNPHLLAAFVDQERQVPDEV